MNIKKSTFCTIITSDYMHYALALRESILQYGDCELHVLVDDFDNIIKEEVENKFVGIKIISCDKICNEGYGKKIFEKYFTVNKDWFRWSLKPVFLNYLISNGFEKVIYIDCDIHFFNSWQFLFEYLNSYDILLSPHNRSMFPEKDPENFQKNYTEGIFNGGFIGVSRNAKDFLNWFALACEYNCIKDSSNGYYVDQKYLDIVPARFDKVLSIKHLGCNVAEWNMVDCKRVNINGNVLINGVYPIVFIHFVRYTIIRIQNESDSLLKPYLDLYENRLKKYNQNCNINQKIKKQIETKLTNNLTIKAKLQIWLKKLVK